MPLKSFYTVRFSDCDPYGHLNNARYLDYMLNAREDHLKEHYQLTLDELMKQGTGFVVHSHEIRYVRPASYNERIAITSRLMEVGTATLHVELLMYDAGFEILKAACWTTFTGVDVRTGKKKEHAPGFLSFINNLVEAGGKIKYGINERVRELMATGYTEKMI